MFKNKSVPRLLYGNFSEVDKKSAIFVTLQKSGTTPVDFIKPGHWLEVQEEAIPVHVWPVRIIENVGGRLLLRYEGAKNASRDFWLFYLNIRLHELGWCKDNEQDGYRYIAPQCE